MHHLRDLRALNPDVSVETAIDVLQNAVQKLKAGFDDFEIDLQRVRKRTLVDQGAISIYTTMTISLWELTCLRLGIQCENIGEDPMAIIHAPDDCSSEVFHKVQDLT